MLEADAGLLEEDIGGRMGDVNSGVITDGLRPTSVTGDGLLKRSGVLPMR